ncbi:transposase [Moorena sp. SIO4A1]|uniref:transposase n=1 Tax=Moorena sp. SIO4A1 TaxID=2607835 RepID=UPI0025F547DD|nr:transposase [Moorena sp. SIO4A1]
MATQRDLAKNSRSTTLPPPLDNGAGFGFHRCVRFASGFARIADSMSVKTTEKRGKSTAHDGGKKVKGRKRHIVVDSQGLMIGVLVTEANGSERD